MPSRRSGWNATASARDIYDSRAFPSSSQAFHARVQRPDQPVDTTIRQLDFAVAVDNDGRTLESAVRCRGWALTQGGEKRAEILDAGAGRARTVRRRMRWRQLEQQLGRHHHRRV